MIKNIIKEVFESDLSGFFDCDCYSKAAGDFGYTVFCVTSHYGNYSSGINEKDFQNITNEFDNIMGDIDSIGYYYKSIKEVMKDYNIPYSPNRAHELKNLANIRDYIDQITTYLSIKTGKKWENQAARGYSQGDYADIIFCADHYESKDISVIGDMFLGCGKEYSITWLNDDGSEGETVYGYYVADSEAWRDQDIKTLVCSYAGLNPDTTQLQLIENIKTAYIPEYRTV